MKKRRITGSRIWVWILIAALAYCLSVPVKAATNTSGTITLNNSWYTGYLAPNQKDQHLIYTFSLPSDGRVTFTTQAFKNDTNFKVSDPDQTKEYGKWTIYKGSDVSPGTETREIWLKAGSYYIDVSNYYSSGSGTVRVKGAFLASGKTEKEPNDSFEKAMPLSAEQNVKGVLLQIDDRYDFYKIVPSSNADIKVEVTCYGKNFGFGIYDSDYERLQYNELSAGTMESPSVRTYTLKTPSKGSTYYLRISNYYKEGTSWGDVYYATGCYKIKWTQGCDHVYGAGKVIKSATCTGKGSREKVCSKCGNKITEVIPAKGHSWNSWYTIDRKATYTNSGSKSIHCSRCNTKKSGSGVVIPKLKAKSTTYPVLTVKTTAILKVKAVKKGFIVKWSRGSGINGYEIQYALNKNFTKQKKTISISNSMVVSKKATKLKAKKTYYVRIRAYRTVNGNKYYSLWSKMKKIKTKK